jgi:phosphate transport system substrate-binding protein
MRALLAALLIAAAVVSAGCAPAQTPTPAPTTLHIAGSTSLKPTLDELAQAFEQDHPNVLINVRGGGTAIGIQQLRAGRADVAAVSWSPDGQTPEGMQAIPLARDGVAVIVHPSNPITNLTTLQIRALYRGEILNWAAVGGPSSEPFVISREDGSGTRAAFETLVMAGERVTLNALVIPTSQAVVDYVATHREAVGYVSTAVLGPAVKAVPLEEVAPIAASLRSGEYALGRVLYLFAPSTPTNSARAFLEFALSPAGQTIIARRLVPVR